MYKYNYNSLHVSKYIYLFIIYYRVIFFLSKVIKQDSTIIHLKLIYIINKLSMYAEQSRPKGLSYGLLFTLI